MTKLDNFKGKRNTKGFKEKPENINRSGANRKLVSTVINELDGNGVEKVTSAQIEDLYLRFINITQEELSVIFNDKTQPMLNRVISKAILSNKGFEVIEKIIDRVHGRPKQSQEITGNNGEALIVNFVPAKKKTE